MSGTDRKSRPARERRASSDEFKTDTDISGTKKQTGYGRDLVPFFPEDVPKEIDSRKSAPPGSARKKKPPRPRSNSEENSPPRARQAVKAPAGKGKEREGGGRESAKENEKKFAGGKYCNSPPASSLPIPTFLAKQGAEEGSSGKGRLPASLDFSGSQLPPPSHPPPPYSQFASKGHSGSGDQDSQRSFDVGASDALKALLKIK
mmetsp:Transcript_40191/g.104110  ORF Transcript_40191/g.104110 Transcript_40191/m.104110 type:complete len:204 (-) Transcript_40191:2938-3549(-)